MTNDDNAKKLAEMKEGFTFDDVHWLIQLAESQAAEIERLKALENKMGSGWALVEYEKLEKENIELRALVEYEKLEKENIELKAQLNGLRRSR